jgi:hypothetical protein
MGPGEEFCIQKLKKNSGVPGKIEVSSYARAGEVRVRYWKATQQETRISKPFTSSDTASGTLVNASIALFITLSA